MTAGFTKDDGFVNDTEMEGPEHAVGGVVPPHRGHPVLHKTNVSVFAP